MRLRMHPGVSVIATRAGVLLRSDVATYQVTGADARAFLERLVPLLDGTRDRAAVVAALGDRSAASVEAVLDGLSARRIIEEAEEGSATGTRRRPIEGRALVVGSAGWGRAAASALEAEGVKTGARPSRIDGLDEALAADSSIQLVVAAVAPEDVVAIERLARAAHRAKLVSLWAHELGGSVVLGPLVVPGETACRVCAMAEPLNPMMVSAVRAARVRGASPALLGDLVAMEALAILRGEAPSRLGGRVMIEDLATWTSSLHTLVRLPWCRVCGAAG